MIEQISNCCLTGTNRANKSREKTDACKKWPGQSKYLKCEDTTLVIHPGATWKKQLITHTQANPSSIGERKNSTQIKGS